MGYERFSLDHEDYRSVAEFLPVLDEEISRITGVLALAATYNLSQCCECDKLFDLYLYKIRLEYGELSSSTLDVPETFAITVNEVNGNGEYYLLDGYNRKPGNFVTIRVVPPAGYEVDTITAGDGAKAVVLHLDITNVYEAEFVMEEFDTVITITYTAASTGVEWTASWYREVCTNDTLANQLVTFEIEWSCDHPYYNIICPVCTSSNTLYKMIWLNEQCTVESATLEIEWHNGVCKSTHTTFEITWEEVACVAPGVIAFTTKWEREICAAPQVDVGKTWEIEWRENICFGSSKVHKFIWEADEMECTSQILTTDYHTLYVADTGSGSFGYGGVGVGDLFPTELGTDKIAFVLANPSFDMFHIGMVGGGKYESKDELHVHIAKSGPLFDVVVTWDSTYNWYTMVNSVLAAYIETQAGELDPLFIQIEHDVFDNETRTIDSFVGNDIKLVDEPLTYSGDFPRTFVVIGGTSDGMAFTAVSDLGTPGVDVILEVPAGEGPVQVGVTAVRIYDNRVALP